jgi:hypothetical protein
LRRLDHALRFSTKGQGLTAQSSGDRRSAPPPDGATEFVDLDCEQAREAGIRYAVMVVNNFSGMPFKKLERGYAGLMIRDGGDGPHFDPQQVLLKFDLQGECGVYLPMVVDLQGGILHWLDLYSQGALQFNNVATSNKDISRRCPEMMAYFASGVRPSMFDLALLHAAARAEHVYLRDKKVQRYSRRPDEDPESFRQRILSEPADQILDVLPDFTASVGAALFRGDLELPADSPVYALLRERVQNTLSASDLLSV